MKCGLAFCYHCYLLLVVAIVLFCLYCESLPVVNMLAGC